MSGGDDEPSELIEPEPNACYDLTLYVSGASELSVRAISNTKRLCETHLEGRYHLSVIDVHEDVAAALLETPLLAAPTLVRNLPLPVRKLVGDLSQIDKVLRALDLSVDETSTARS